MDQKEAFDRACKALRKAHNGYAFGDMASLDILQVVIEELRKQFKQPPPAGREG